MAIVLDTPASVSISAGTSLVIPSVVISASDNFLLVAVALSMNTNYALVPTSVILNSGGGLALTKAPLQAIDSYTGNASVNITYWYYQNPPAGTFNVTITAPGACTAAAASAHPMQSVHATSPILSQNIFGGTQSALSSISLKAHADWRAGVAGDVYFGAGFVVGNGTALTSTGANQTNRVNIAPIHTNSEYAIDTIPGANAGNFTWGTNATPFSYYGMNVIGIRAASSAVAIPVAALPDAQNALSMQGTGATLSRNFICPPGTNFLIVTVNNTAATPASVTGVTYGGVSLTKFGADIARLNDTTNLWYLANPTIGNATLTVSAALPQNAVDVTGSPWSGVNTVAPFGTEATATGSSAAVAVTATGATNADTYIGWHAATGSNTSDVIAGGANQLPISLTHNASFWFDTNYILGSNAGAFSWTLGASMSWVAGAVTVKGPTGAILLGDAADITASIGSLSTAINVAATAIDTVTAAGVLQNYATVTLTAPLYTGVGSVADPNFWALYGGNVPVAGDLLYYDPTFITIAPNGEISSTTNNCSALVQFNDGTGLSIGLIIITPFMVGTGASTVTASGALQASVRLVAAASTLVSATGVMGVKVQLASSVSTVITATGALSSAIQLLGAALDITTAAGPIGTGAQFSATAQQTTAAAGALTTKISMASAATNAVTAAASFATQIPFAAAAQTVIRAAANLSTAALLNANAVTTTTASGVLLVLIRMASAAQNVIRAVGALSTQIQLYSNALDTVTGSGKLTTSTPISSDSFTITTALAILTTGTRFTAAANSLNSASGILSTAIVALGSALTSTQASAALTTNQSPAGLYSTDATYIVYGPRTYFTPRFRNIAPGDRHVLGFDFSDDLIVGETLTGIIIISIVCSAGTDLTPAARMLQGIAAFNKAMTQALQPVAKGIAGNDYYFTVTALTTNEQKILTRTGLLPCRR